MTTIEIPTDNTMQMVWSIRKKIYEETKGMSDAEWEDYVRKGSESFRREVEKQRSIKQRTDDSA